MSKTKESRAAFDKRMSRRLELALYNSDAWHELDPFPALARHLYDVLVTAARASLPGYQRSSAPFRLQVETAVDAAARRIRRLERWAPTFVAPELQPKGWKPGKGETTDREEVRELLERRD